MIYYYNIIIAPQTLLKSDSKGHTSKKIKKQFSAPLPDHIPKYLLGRPQELSPSLQLAFIKVSEADQSHLDQMYIKCI
jgi:hypothetical protein